MFRVNGITSDDDTNNGYSINCALSKFTFEEVLLLLSHNYERYCENLLDSTDEVVQTIANYMKYCAEFELYLASTREGDSIAMESLMTTLLPLWKAAHKPKYVNLTCTNSEVLYKIMDPNTLELMRINRCSRLSVGKGMIGMDDVCEQLNDHTKAIVQSKSYESHMNKSLYMNLFRCCSYRESKKVKETDDETIASSIPPKRKNEINVLNKLFNLVSPFENKGRKLTNH